MFFIDTYRLLANRLREKNIPYAYDFIREWMSFNACYYHIGTGNERDKVISIIQNYIPTAKADFVLNQVNDSIEFFSLLPPGDTRKADTDVAFRKKSMEDTNIVLDESNSPEMRLSHLMAVRYQGSCNLMQGEKDPDSFRDEQVVLHSLTVINFTLTALLEE